jgi:large repetitive protein
VNPVPSQPVVTAGGATTFCAGGSVVLSAPAGFATYAWSNGATTQSITANTTGSYSVVVGNASGCTSIASAAIAVTVNPSPAQPTVSASGVTTFCAGGNVVLTSSAANAYLWSNGATTQSITVSTSGSYSVSEISANGCTSVASAATAVTVNPIPTTPTISSSGATTFCTGGSVTLTAPAGAASYIWSNGATTRSIVVSNTGSFTVQIASAAGCSSAVSASTSVTVNPVPAQPTVSVGGPTTFCSGGSVVLTAPTSTSYSWSNGATTQSITVSASGSYSVTVSNAQGCSSVALLLLQ